MKQRSIVILGGGFGGFYTTLKLEKALRSFKGINITLISNENFFLFTPFLHEVAVGRIETRHIAYPINQLRIKKRFDFIQAEVECVDLGGHIVTTSRGNFHYDYLVLALGSNTDVSALPHPEQRILFLKDLHDSIVLRNHIIKMFENAEAEMDPHRHAELLTFIVAGGGYTGVQLVAEIRDFVWRTLVKHYPHVSSDSIKIILIQESLKILGDMDPKLSAVVLKTLEHQGIIIKFYSRITHIGVDHIKINNGEIISTRTVVWATGVRANPVVEKLPVPHDAMGRVIVDPYLELPGFPGVYALGDNAHFQEPKTGEVLQPRAHIAVRQAKTVATNIVADIKGQRKIPYRYCYIGEIVSLGSGSAVAKIYGLRLHGFMARVIWLIAYLAIIKGYYNRTRILLDWFLSLIFGRDITLLRLERLR